MQALQALIERVSVARLVGPAPTEEQRNTLFRAALRAADHGALQPWRFLVIEDTGLEALGALFCEAALMDDPDLGEARQEKYKNMPGRAPLIIVAVASLSEHPKVPLQEQIIAAGAAAQNLINAAFALELGAMWRTGEMAYHAHVRHGLGLSDKELIIGYIYLGQPAGSIPAPKTPQVQSFVQSWP